MFLFCEDLKPTVSKGSYKKGSGACEFCGERHQAQTVVKIGERNSYCVDKCEEGTIGYLADTRDRVILGVHFKAKVEMEFFENNEKKETEKELFTPQLAKKEIEEVDDEW